MNRINLLPKTRLGWLFGLVITLTVFAVYYLPMPEHGTPNVTSGTSVYHELQDSYYGNYQGGIYRASHNDLNLTIQVPKAISRVEQREMIVTVQNKPEPTNSTNPSRVYDISLIVTARNKGKSTIIPIQVEHLSSNSETSEQTIIPIGLIPERGTITQRIWLRSPIEGVNEGDQLQLDFWILENNKDASEANIPDHLDVSSQNGISPPVNLQSLQDGLPPVDKSLVLIRAHWLMNRSKPIVTISTKDVLLQSFIRSILLPPWANGLLVIISLQIAWFVEWGILSLNQLIRLYTLSSEKKEEKNIYDAHINFGGFVSAIFLICLWVYFSQGSGKTGVLKLVYSIFPKTFIMFFVILKMWIWVVIIIVVLYILWIVTKGHIGRKNKEKVDKDKRNNAPSTAQNDTQITTTPFNNDSHFNFQHSDISLLLNNPKQSAEIFRALQELHPTLPILSSYFNLFQEQQKIEDGHLDALFNSIAVTDSAYFQNLQGERLLNALLDAQQLNSTRTAKFKDGKHLLDAYLTATSDTQTLVVQRLKQGELIYQIADVVQRESENIPTQVLLNLFEAIPEEKLRGLVDPQKLFEKFLLAFRQDSHLDHLAQDTLLSQFLNVLKRFPDYLIESLNSESHSQILNTCKQISDKSSDFAKWFKEEIRHKIN